MAVKKRRRKLHGSLKKPDEFIYRRPAASDKERYRVTQLMVSGMIFVLLVAVKLLFPKQMVLVREPLGQMLDSNMDVTEVFAAVGNVLSGGTWEENAVYQAVFGPQDNEGVIIDEEERENTAFDREHEDAVLYTQTNLPENVNLQQAVLGFDYCTPVIGSISSYFGYRKEPAGESDRFHYGLDIAAEKGTEIVSFADGVVTVTAESSSYGNYLIVMHDNGCTTLYAHCEKLYARSGQSVKRGEKIAAVGDTGQTTGTHLHFELQQDGIFLNPVYYVL